ncbi:MAG: helix-turn-helix domain-containing protein [Egibacteraceae bacterium]
MLTVPQAAARTCRSPETIRRWIRSGKLRAQKVGTQHLIDEKDLEALSEPGTLPIPKSWDWDRTITGEPMPDVVAAIRLSRQGH